MKLNSTNCGGFLALVVVLVVGAAALTLTLGSSLRQLTRLDFWSLADGGQSVAGLAEGCLEFSLHRLRLDTNFTGSTLNLPSGSCIITVTAFGAGQREIIIVATAGEFSRQIIVAANVNTRTVTLMQRD